ncbi:MAG: three-helix bundle dimerization domain-containing protein [Thermomicrobiales bacterium]
MAGAPWIDRCVDDVVTELWENPVKSFVPLLAMRHVRCCIQAGSCDCGEC